MLTGLSGDDPIPARRDITSPPANCYDLGLCARAERVPRAHQLSSSLERIAAAVCALYITTDLVRERSLGNLPREAGAITAPVAECRPKAVLSRARDPHSAMQTLDKRVVPKRLAVKTAWEYPV